MYVNSSVTDYTLSLFKPSAGQSNPRDAVVDRASRYQPRLEAELEGIYDDPATQKVRVTELSELTQKALDVIRSLRENELVAMKANLRQRMEQELGRELAPDERMTSLSTNERMSLSSETRDLSSKHLHLGIVSGFAEKGGLSSGGRSYSLDGKYRDLSDAELADKLIRDHSAQQVRLIQKTMEMAHSDEYRQYMTGTEEPTNLGEKLTPDQIQKMTEDIYQQNKARFERGELNLKVHFWANQDDTNQYEPYRVFDFATGTSEVYDDDIDEFEDL